MIQLSGGIALASMAGCLGSDENPEDDPGDTNDETDDTGDESKGDENAGDEKPKSGDDAPEVEVETPDGKTVTIEPKDEPTVVLFADITSEMGKSHSETLAHLHEEYGDYAYMVTINSNLDVSEDDLEAFHEEYGGDWDHAMGTEDALDKYGIDAAVTICIIDEDGTVVFRADGEIDREAIEEAIEVYSEH